MRSIFFLFLATLVGVSAFVPPSPSSHQNGGATSYTNLDTRHYFDLGSMISNFGKKATISHILIGPAASKTGRGMEQDDARAKLEQLKTQINNDPDKFAAAANEFSSCRTSNKIGGDLGEFGPGLLVKPIDQVCFQEEVGVVHGPISSPFGEHLVLVRERN